MLRVSNVGFDGGTTMPETTTVESCSCCGERFRWDPTMYRLCAACLYQMERLEASVSADDTGAATGGAK